MVFVAARRVAPTAPVGVGNVPSDRPVRRGHHGVDRGAADLRAASTIAAARAEDRLLPDSLSPVEGTAPPHTVAPVPCEGQRQRSAKCPLLDRICPLFEHDRPDHALTARTADRAVLIELTYMIPCRDRRHPYSADPAEHAAWQEKAVESCRVPSYVPRSGADAHVERAGRVGGRERIWQGNQR